MICNTCGRTNPGHLIFCEECGQKLAPRLASPTPPQGVPSLGETERSSAPGPAGTTRPSQAPQRPTAPDVQFTMRTHATPGDDRTPCPLCGSRNQRGLRFCVTCGHLLAQRPSIAPLAPPRASAGGLPTGDPGAAPSDAAGRASAAIGRGVTNAAGGTGRVSTIPSTGFGAGPPIAPNRVVQLGETAAAVETRICPRCRGAVEGPGQYCRFCGAPLGDTPVAVAAPPTPAVGSPPASYRGDAAPAGAMAFGGAPAPPPSLSTAGAPSPSPEPEAGRPPAGAGAPLATTVAMFSPRPERARLVLIARDGGEGPSYGLGESTDIGRSEGQIVVAEDPYVSPRHARISLRGGSYYLRDLGSTNGIYLRIPFRTASGDGADGAGRYEPSAAGAPRGGGGGGGDADREHELRDQELFLVGQQVLRFEVVKHADEGFGVASDNGTLLFGTPASSRYARISQRTVEGVVRDVFYVRKTDTVIGRESGDIVFTDDPFLSRRHAVLRVHGAAVGSKGPRRFTLSDLGSSNGTFVQLREEVRLRPGDHFRIGQQLFRFDVDANRAGA